MPDPPITDHPGPQVRSAAPGRANLMGEHTDYNDGLVLPVALELRTVVSGRRAPDVALRSDGHPGLVRVDLASGEGPTSGWGRYVTAVVRVLREANLPMRGVEGRIRSSVPAGSGLSSSAALEVAVALALLEDRIDAVALARLMQRAENRHVGVQSGILDQLASAGCTSGFAMRIDCRSLEVEHVPIPEGLRILVVDSGQRRELSAGEYNVRRAECEQAARLLGVHALRDVEPDALPSLDLPVPLAGRVRHVVSENARVEALCSALRADDRRTIRELFAASHASLEGDFAVSTPRLDALVAAANAVPGVAGARMTGAGFGGSIVALVDADRSAVAGNQVLEGYRALTGHEGRAWLSPASAGALELRWPS